MIQILTVSETATHLLKTRFLDVKYTNDTPFTDGFQSSVTLFGSCWIHVAGYRQNSDKTCSFPEAFFWLCYYKAMEKWYTEKVGENWKDVSDSWKSESAANLQFGEQKWKRWTLARANTCTPLTMLLSPRPTHELKLYVAFVNNEMHPVFPHSHQQRNIFVRGRWK